MGLEREFERMINSPVTKKEEIDRMYESVENIKEQIWCSKYRADQSKILSLQIEKEKSMSEKMCFLCIMQVRRWQNLFRDNADSKSSKSFCHEDVFSEEEGDAQVFLEISPVHVEMTEWDVPKKNQINCNGDRLFLERAEKDTKKRMQEVSKIDAMTKESCQLLTKAMRMQLSTKVALLSAAVGVPLPSTDEGEARICEEGIDCAWQVSQFLTLHDQLFDFRGKLKDGMGKANIQAYGSVGPTICTDLHFCQNVAEEHRVAVWKSDISTEATFLKHVDKRSREEGEDGISKGDPFYYKNVKYPAPWVS